MTDHPGLPTFGSLVKLRHDIMPNYARLRVGYVIGFGVVNPRQYPVPADLDPVPVVIVANPIEPMAVDIWGLDRIVVVSRS